jgi:hypothetical protein
MGVKQRVFKRKVHRITVLQELKPADYPRRFCEKFKGYLMNFSIEHSMVYLQNNLKWRWRHCAETEKGGKIISIMPNCQSGLSV